MAVFYVGDNGPDGACLGTGATEKVAFYGATPVTQRAAAIQASSLISTSALATVGATLQSWMLEVTNTLTGLGIWKGSA